MVRIGKKLRKRVNPTIKRHSLIPDTAVFSRKDFPWLSDLEAVWPDIQAEAKQVLQYREAIPPLSEISPDHARLDRQGLWRSYFLHGYGFRSNENCDRCPETCYALSKVPGLRTALFSIHGPGMRIAPHKGVTAGICVIHLGLIIPKDRQNCAIRVADQTVHWSEGEAFAFDDTRQHETWNDTDEERVILLLHVDRPVAWPGRLLAQAFMTAIRWSPFVGDARRKMRAWNLRFAQMESKPSKL